MKKTIYAIILVSAILFAIGTEGACLMDTISFGQAVLQEVIAILCVYGSYRLIKLEEDRNHNRMVS